jgi:hypothetical protein
MRPMIAMGEGGETMSVEGACAPLPGNPRFGEDFYQRENALATSPGVGA